MIKHQPRKFLPPFQISDFVLIHRTAFRTSYTMQLNKFDDCWYDPFEILKIVNPNTYKVKLPPSFRHHNIINVGFLHYYRRSDKYPRSHPDSSRPPASIDAFHPDSELEFEVETILKHHASLVLSLALLDSPFLNN